MKNYKYLCGLNYCAAVPLIKFGPSAQYLMMGLWPHLEKE